MRLEAKQGKSFKVSPLIVGAVIFLQSFYCFILAPPASGLAGVAGAIKINEFSATGSSGWIELYNTTAAPVDITGWHLQNETDVQKPLEGMLVPHGFLLVQAADFLTDTSGVIRLFDDVSAIINMVSYGGISLVPVPDEGKSSSRVTDGGEAWQESVPTPGITNEVDTLPPTVPSGGTPHDTVVTTHGFSFTWEAATDVNSEVTYELQARVGAQPDESTPVLGSLTTPSVPFQAVDGFGDGEWYWRVRAVDEAQNRSDWSNVWHVTVDATGPGITINLPLAGGVFGGPGSRQIPLSVSITDQSGVSSHTVELDGNDVTAQVAVEGAPDAQVRNLTAVFESTALADGEHTLHVSTTDRHGVVSEASLLFIVDGTNPVVTTNIKQNQVLQNIVSIEGEAADPRLSSFNIRIFNSEGEPLVLDAQNDSKEWAANEVAATTAAALEWDTSLVADGSYKIQLTARDNVGNETVLTRTVIVNNVPDVIGGGPITDPLLDQLSKQLAQPFPVVANLAPPAYIPDNTIQKASDTNVSSIKVSVPETDRNAETVAIAPSEEGWRIYGVAWYWWLLLALATSFILYRWRLVYKETRAPRFEEA